jgi:hypothetical protein
VVWRGFDEVLGRPVAVKQLAPKLLADPRSRRRIQAEARAAALLSHPHIAQVYDFGHGPDGAPYVVMELVTGRSLQDAGPLPPGELLRAGAQLAAALAAVHARGLVHHDVKPANVAMCSAGLPGGTPSGASAAGAQWMASAASPPVDCAVQYSIRDERDRTVIADLQLTASGGHGGWSLTFRMPAGQAIGAVDGATWHQDGQSVLLGGTDLADLSAGAHFAVTAARSGSPALPTGFALNGSSCRTVLLVPAAVVPSASHPAQEDHSGRKGKKKNKGG